MGENSQFPSPLQIVQNIYLLAALGEEGVIFKGNFFWDGCGILPLPRVYEKLLYKRNKIGSAVGEIFQTKILLLLTKDKKYLNT